MPRNYQDDPWPEIHKLIANCFISKSIEMILEKPELLDKLSKGHRELGIERGNVSDESVLAISCAKGYSHVNSDITIGYFSDIKELLNRLGISEFLPIIDEIDPNTELSLLEIAAIRKNYQEYDFLVRLGAREDKKNYLNKTPKELLDNPSIPFPKIGDIIDVLFDLQEKDASLDIGVDFKDTLGNTPLHICLLTSRPCSD